MVGEMGFKPMDVYLMTYFEISAAIIGYREKVKSTTRLQMELSRKIAYSAISPYLKKHVNTPQKFWPLPWDRKRQKVANVRELWAKGEFSEHAKNIFKKFPDKPVATVKKLTKKEAAEALKKLNRG